MQHEQIEAEEEERVREFQGISDEEQQRQIPQEGELNVGPRGQAQAVFDSANAAPGAVRDAAAPAAPLGQGRQRSAADIAAAAAEEAMQKRKEYALAQAAKFGKDVNEAKQRGDW